MLSSETGRDHQHSTYERPVKRVKLDHGSHDRSSQDADVDITRRHPLGVRPAGNAYLSQHNLKPAMGNFSRMPEELLMLLLELLDARSLLRLGRCCRALHAFTRSEDLWRALFTESHPISFSWRGSWRSTLLQQDRSREPAVDCSNLFSDVLHRPFFCSLVPVESYATGIPAGNQIPRLSNATPGEVFASNRPLILTDPVKSWPLYRTWNVDHLLQRYAKVKFRAEAVDWPLNTYVQYMRNNTDESPLYLFDRSFAEKMDLKIGSPADARTLESHNDEEANDLSDSTIAYWPPACFGADQDLFSVLGPQRPDHRWLIVGPARSGSTFHKDPNNTSAWNAVLQGRKYWIMFPSSSSLPPPPGVHVSADESEVTSPLSIAEWLLTFHAEARATPGCKEGICEAGEVLYVPSGWFHLVLNLDESVALTQNFVPRGKLADVLAFLRDKPEQVSGFKGDVEDPYSLFVSCLEHKEPQALAEAQSELEKRDQGRKSRWQEITKTEDESAGGFSFGFGQDSEEDVP